MNRRLSIVFLWIVLACLALMITGCPKSGSSDNPDATLIGTWPETSFSQELAGRYDLVELGTADIPVFMDAGTVPVLDQSTREGVVQAFEQGQPIVVLDAFQPDVDLLIELFGCKKTFEIVVQDDDDGSRPAVAFCKTSSGLHTFETQTEGEGEVLEQEVSGLVRWLEERVQITMEKGVLRDDITDLVEKPTHTWTYTDDKTSDDNGSCYNQVTAQYVLLYSCTNEYWVAGVWMSLETQVLTKPKKLFVFEKTFGYAMYPDNAQDSDIFNLPAGATSLTLGNINPPTDIGTTSYSSGVDFSISGQVDTGGTGAIAGGVTFSNSVSHDIPTTYIYEAAQLLEAWPIWFFYPSRSYFKAGGTMSYNTSWTWTLDDIDENSDFLDNGGMVLAAGTIQGIIAASEKPDPMYHDPSELDKFSKHTSKIVFGTAPKGGCDDSQ